MDFRYIARGVLSVLKPPELRIASQSAGLIMVLSLRTALFWGIGASLLWVGQWLVLGGSASVSDAFIVGAMVFVVAFLVRRRTLLRAYDEQRHAAALRRRAAEAAIAAQPAPQSGSVPNMPRREKDGGTGS